MRAPQRPFWAWFLCRIGWHREIGTTIANYIRCYGCSRNYDEARKVWLKDSEFIKSSFYQARCEQQGGKQ